MGFVPVPGVKLAILARSIGLQPARQLNNSHPALAAVGWPEMADVPAQPNPLGYERLTFGWLESESAVELVLPPLGTTVIWLEEVWSLLLSSGLTVAVVAFLCVLVNVQGLTPLILLVSFALSASALVPWVWTIRRIARVASTVSSCATICVTETHFTVTDPAAPLRVIISCRRSEIAGLRLDMMQSSRYLNCRIRLQVTKDNSDVMAVRLPWPRDAQLSGYEERLRTAVGLPARRSYQELEDDPCRS